MIFGLNIGFNDNSTSMAALLEIAVRGSGAKSMQVLQYFRALFQRLALHPSFRYHFLIEKLLLPRRRVRRRQSNGLPLLLLHLARASISPHDIWNLQGVIVFDSIMTRYSREV